MSALAPGDIRNIVGWLRQTEERLGILYARAAEVCREDPLFCDFLERLSREEKSHQEFMSLVCDRLCDDREQVPLDVLLDRQTRARVEGVLKRFQRLLTKTTVPKKSIIDYMARAETSELNPIFLYVMEECRKAGREGERMTSEIQGHLLRIQDFINSLPLDQKPSVDVAALPFVGRERFLVVEDHAPLRRLVASLLARRGVVDTASDGHEGLETLREHSHNGIVADIQMPGMDGLEFYRRAVEYDPRLKGRFLFCSGDTTSANEDYLREHGLPILRKPFGLEEFQAAMDKILDHST